MATLTDSSKLRCLQLILHECVINCENSTRAPFYRIVTVQNVPLNYCIITNSGPMGNINNYLFCKAIPKAL